jgi:hypothetical protein
MIHDSDFGPKERYWCLSGCYSIAASGMTHSSERFICDSGVNQMWTGIIIVSNIIELSFWKQLLVI